MAQVGLNNFILCFQLLMVTISMCHAAVVIPSVSVCPTPWIIIEGQCFLVVKEILISWNQARRYCQNAATGGDLAQPRNIRALAHYLSVNGFGVTHYWLGGTDAGHEGQWRWANGGPIPANNWLEGEPDDKDFGTSGADCLRLQPATALFSLLDAPCEDTWAFVCERPHSGDNTIITDPIQESVCPASWIPIDGQCSLIVKDRLTWHQARDHCQNAASGADLAQPRNIRAFAQYLSDNGFGVTHYWIGGTDAGREGEWRWVSGGQIPANNWLEGEPDDADQIYGGSGADCLRLQPATPSNSLIDDRCGDTWAFVCQRP